MVSLTPVKKREIVQAYSKLGSLRSVAKECKVHRKTARHWVEVYQSTGQLEDVRGGGRKLELGPAQLSRVVSHLQNPGATTKSASNDLYESGLAPRVMDRSSISKLLRRGRQQQQTDMVYTRQKPVKELSEQNKALRVDFALANRNRNWNHVLFTDRKRFSFKNPGVAVYPGQWVHKGQRVHARYVNHPATYNLYCGMCRFGTTNAVLVAGTTGHTGTYKTKQGTVGKNITQDEYNKSVLPKLLTDGGNIFFGMKVRRWTFQQDNDHAHAMAENIINESKTQASLLLNWPPNSPDLNPIENLWSEVDNKVQAMGCTTFKQFIQEVDKALADVSTDTLKKLVDSMDERLDLVIRGGGEKIDF